MHVHFFFPLFCPDRWVHVMCAVAVLEAKFVNIAERSPVDVGKIPLQRFRLVRITCASLLRFQSVSPVCSEPVRLCLSLQPQVISSPD